MWATRKAEGLHSTEVSRWQCCRCYVLANSQSLRNKSVGANSGIKDVSIIPAGMYLLKVNKRNTSTGCEICSNLTRETLAQGVKYVQS